MSGGARTLLALSAGLVAGLVLGRLDLGGLASATPPADANTNEVAAALGDGPSAPQAAAPTRPADLVEAHERERAAWRAERAAFEAEQLRLVGELENALAERVAREAEFVEFTTMLSSIVPAEAPPEMHALFGQSPPAPEPEPEPEPPSPEELARSQRSAELTRQIKALLVTERLDSLELLEGGVLIDGALGPVVFRTLDERGRPIGSLIAERLHLEGSRLARTLTIVLEDGYERDGTTRTPFPKTPPGAERGGVRRILLHHTNPGPWMESCPELFDPEALTTVRDDGTWRVPLVRRELNLLLESDTARGFYKVLGLGGVVDADLCGVEIAQLDSSGSLIKRLFADRATIALVDRGVQLTLVDGVQERGGRKLDFLGGRYRIFLPAARHEDWTAAGLPGLVPNAESPLSTSVAR